MKTLDICEKLYTRYESLETVYHYYGILAVYGLIKTAEEKKDDALLKKCVEILDRFPDKIKHDVYNFPSYKICGLAKAYAFMKGYVPHSEQQVREYAEEIMTAARDPKGIIKNPHKPEENLIWIDVAMAVSTYLVFAGVAFKEDRYFDEAVNQTILMYDEFMDKENGLLHQCKNFIAPGKYSEDHWSRGNGWGFIALTELIEYLPADHPQRKKVEQYFINHAKAFLPFQSKRGLWRQEIPFEYAYEESSGSALILYGIGKGLRLGILDEATFAAPYKKGVEALAKYCISSDCSTFHCCEGCLCPGEGEERGTLMAYITQRLPFQDEHHSFGPFMLALTEAYKNGITELQPEARKK